MTAIFERRAFRPIDETSVPSMRIVPKKREKMREDERREEEMIKIEVDSN